MPFSHRIPSFLLALLLAASSATGRADSALWARSLAGSWRCRLDPEDVGIREGWAAQGAGVPIRLPGTLATNGLGPKVEKADRGQLTPTHRYVGPAWYQRAVDVPDAWSGLPVTLHLERVLMRSTVWIDGVQVGGPIDHLGVPHRHPLGLLKPGRHTLTVRVDNRDVLGGKLGQGHHTYDGMQTLWNGLVGRLALVAVPPVSLDLVRLFPSWRQGTLGLEATVLNETGPEAARPLGLVLREKATGKVVAEAVFPVAATAGRTTVRHTLKLSQPPRPWDEFQPNLYRAEVRLGAGGEADFYTADIGFRDLGARGPHLTINGRPFSYRNNHDGGTFPRTGFPPTDVASWKRILRVYKAHGLNGIRFHSWTPPEAAFTAADELGLYVQSEHFWNRPDATPEVAAFARAEMRAGLDHYGNHPSHCYVLYGNELGGDLKTYGAWLQADRAHDPRHLYSVAAGRKVPGDDFWEYGAKMNWQAPSTDWDYRGYFEASSAPAVPEITHELGQPVTHPDWRELARYTGVLRPRNYEGFREKARQAGVEAQSAAFQAASGNLNRINYKHDIEALLRTPQSAGYSLLDMHDYPGQGEALVGWLDAFYRPKGFLSPRTFRQYGSATVPLARLPKFVFTDGETLRATAELAHYGAGTLRGAVLRWTLRDDAARVLASGQLPAADVPVGTVARLGALACPLRAPTDRGVHRVLEFRIAGTPHANRWDLWVFPKAGLRPEPADVLVTSDLGRALHALEAGGKVLLLAHRLGKGALPGTYACFKPPFWSTTYGFSQQSGACGAVVRHRHPALAGFPTEGVLDWQWQPLCADAADFDAQPKDSWRDLPRIPDPDARGFNLKGFPSRYRPIVQPVPDFQHPLKLGTIFDVNTPGGGRLLVCGYNLADALEARPVARQLRRSLLAYMASEAFRPDHTVDQAWIRATFATSVPPAPMPPGFERAYLHIRAGAHHPTGEGSVSWEAPWDAVARTDEGLRYTVEGAAVRADGAGTGWAGRKIRIEIRVREAVGGILRIRFHDGDRAGRRGLVRCEDGQQQILGPHGDGLWLDFPLRREDSLDGLILLEAETTAGSDLRITELALVPR